MKPIFGGVIAFLIAVAIVAGPASANEEYVASADYKGNAAYLAVNPDGSFSGPDDLQLISESGLSGSGKSYGNGIGDFDGDGDLDYIMAVGSSGGHVYIFPKTEPGNNFDLPIRVASFSEGAVPADMTVADFNDDDNADLAVSYENFLDIYTGNGDGTFELAYSYDLPMMNKNSPLDNGDFNHDGNQDLIVGNYGNDPASLAVLYGNGKGDFTYSDNDIYTRSGLMERKAILGISTRSFSLNNLHGDFHAHICARSLT